MLRLPRIQISDDLHVSIGEAAVHLSPAHGLRIAETLARKSFRRVMTEEAAKAPSVSPARPVRRSVGR